MKNIERDIIWELDLTDNNVHVSVRGTNTVRVTPHLWINDNDIDKFVDVVKKYFKK